MQTRPFTRQEGRDRADTGESDEAADCSDLNRRGRLARLIATLVVGVLLVGGTVWGTDDDFPLGPFHMYSWRDDPNGAVRELRVQVITESGRVVDVTGAAGAPRRAELEGRVPELVADPTQLARLAPTYTAAVPHARSLRLVWRVHPLQDGRAQTAHDEPICAVRAGSP